MKCRLDTVYQLSNIHGFTPPAYQGNDVGLDLFRNDDGSYAGQKYRVADGYFLPEDLAERIIEFIDKAKFIYGQEFGEQDDDYYSASDLLAALTHPPAPVKKTEES